MNIVIVGRREEGKTTLAKFVCRRYKAKIFWDPRAMIGCEPNGVIVCSADDLEIAIEEGDWRGGPIVYRPESGDVEGEFAEVCGVLFPPKFTRGGFAFLIDEAGDLQNAHGVSPDLKRVIKQHPTFPPQESVMVVQTNHRLAEYNNSCKALLDELYIFQTTLPGDLKTLEEHTGMPEIIPIVKTLPHHHCVRYLYGRQSSGRAQYEIWDDPTYWYEPLKGGAPCNVPAKRDSLFSNQSTEKSVLPEEEEYA
jgi:hypothetical protein